MPCPVLTQLSAYAAAMRCPVLTLAMLLPASGGSHRAICTPVNSATRLCVCYAMSGTDIAYGATRLRACYAMSGADLPYGAIRLRACYAMCGTDIAYGAAEFELYDARMYLHDPR
eukprot:197497-Rhodomonas_salina.2